MAPCLANTMAIPDLPALFPVDAEGRERLATKSAAAALTSPSTVAEAPDSRFFLVYFLCAASIDKHGAQLELHVPGNHLSRSDLRVLRSREVKHHLEKKYRRR